MEQNLFGNEPAVKSTELIIRAGQKKVLTKSQDAFNKLTKRIEKLHKEIERQHLIYDQVLKIYAEEHCPLQKEQVVHTKAMVAQLWEIYKLKQLPKSEQADLKKIIKRQLQKVLDSMTDVPDEGMQNLYTEIEGESYEVAREREKEEMRQELKDTFNEMDVDIDLDNVDLTDEEEMVKKMAEFQQKIYEKMKLDEAAYNDSRKPQKKTKKQLENEAKTAATSDIKQKSISILYKQLAKIFHPDLEQDLEKKLEKEILMKELVAAYEAKNMHLLLTMELKWIHKETNHLNELTEEKLAIYLQVLREQAQKLEREKYQIGYLPKYSVLLKEFGPNIFSQSLLKIKNECKHLAFIITQLKEDLVLYKKENNIKEIKKLIKVWKNDQEEYDMNEMFEMMFDRNDTKKYDF